MRLGRGISAVALAAALCAFVQAQSYFENFEAPRFTPDLTVWGQEGWYNPVSGSSEWFVRLYVNNPLNIGANPNGGGQMIAAVKNTTGSFARAQQNFNFGQRTKWLVSYDVYVSFDTQYVFNYDNIGSFSLQPSAAPTQFFIDLFQWVTPSGDIQEGNINDGWRATWVTSDSGGTSQWIISYGQGTPFHGLQINRWYRRYVAFDLQQGVLVKVGIRDLTTNQLSATRVGPTESFQYWYLVNYNNSSRTNPSAFRFFVGGGTGANNGNILAVDNISFTGFSVGDVDMNGCVDDADLLEVLFAFGSQGAFLPADVNSDGTVDDADLLEVLFAFGEGC
jgi:hypothetical protein